MTCIFYVTWKTVLDFCSVPRKTPGKHKHTLSLRLKAYCSACVPVQQIDHHPISHSFHGYRRNIAMIQRHPLIFFYDQKAKFGSASNQNSAEINILYCV